MFKKLRNKFIITNVVITTVILVLSFAVVFLAARTRDWGRPLVSQEKPFMKDREVRDIFEKEIEAEREQNLTSLAFILLGVGLGTELLVFAASYYIAEKSIGPVKDAYKKQQEFVANASHELKTPIAAAQANFEALAATEQPWAGNVEMELGRASDLVNDMLKLAQVESDTVVLKCEDANVGALVKRQAELVRSRLGDKTLKLKVPGKINAKIDSGSFTQIVDILLDNAVKYSDKRIEITLDEHSLSVKNDGKGIPEEKLPHVFDRFYQVDKTATGVGLGLSIAKSIADNNAWDLSVKSEKNKTEFILRFS